MNLDLEDLQDDDVVSINGEMMRVRRFRHIVSNVFKDEVANSVREVFAANDINIIPSGNPKNQREWLKCNSNQWFLEGIEFEVLRMGAPQWVEGKIKLKVSLEFESEEASKVEKVQEVSEQAMAFPLDEIRQTLNGVNSIDA